MNTAQVIQFPTPDLQPQEASKSMYSDKFKNGYVMSSRLYRDEVRPFLTDAARNVYVELENRINGCGKDADFISWTQLQGGVLEDSRKMSLSTVKVGLAQLLANEVVSIVEIGRQGVKKYTINEVSLVGRKVIKPTEKESSKYFRNSSTTVSEVLRKPKRNTSETEVNHFGNRSESTSETEDTIDIYSLDNLEDEEDKAQAKFQPQSRPLNFVQYHTDDRTQISFPELCKKYPAQLDFQDQAKASFPDHSPNRIFENLKKMAQWSLDKSNHSPQKWMTIWLDTFMKNLPSDSELAATETRKTQKIQPQTPKAEKPKRVSRFGQFLKNNSTNTEQPKGEIYDV